MIVYKIRNKINNKCYVGITSRSLRQRWSEHKHYARSELETPLYRAIRKYGYESFSVDIIGRADNYEALKELEIQLIKSEGAGVLCGGYNVSHGGDGFIGYVRSEDCRRKSSELTKLQFLDPERRMKQVIASTGKKASEETKAKMSKAHMGRVFSEESRNKISLALKGKKKSPEHIEALKRAKKNSTSAVAIQPWK